MSVNFESLIWQIQSVQTALQQSTAHAINTCLTIRNWLIGYYIVEFEQKGNDRAQYGEKLLKNLENRLNAKGMTERRFREFRQFYITYPQIGTEIQNFLTGDTIQQISQDDAGFSIRHLPTAESLDSIRRLPTAEFKGTPMSLIISKLSYTHLSIICNIDNLVKRTFYEMEC
jgi:hypothetical protein